MLSLLGELTDVHKVLCSVFTRCDTVADTHHHNIVASICGCDADRKCTMYHPYYHLHSVDVDISLHNISHMIICRVEPSWVARCEVNERWHILGKATKCTCILSKALAYARRFGKQFLKMYKSGTQIVCNALMPVFRRPSTCFSFVVSKTTWHYI